MNPARRAGLRLLHLEDDEADAALIAACLEQGDILCELVRVDTREAFEAEVQRGGYDAIFSDYKLPGYGGAAALEFARAHRPDVPFILISGTLGEEAAVRSLLGGATDYVLKERLSRLVPALHRALREAENARARRAAEEALQRSEQRYRRLFEASKDGILLLDAATGTILDANPSLLELLGRPRDALLGKTPIELGISGDEVTEEALRARSPDMQARYPNLRLRNGARLVSVELVASEYDVDAQRVIQLNLRDITERRRLEDELRQAQRLEAVGRLAGGVAHDFNNLLSVINNYCELVIATLPPDHPSREDLTEVHKAGVRGAALTRQLLAFSRKQLLNPVVCSVNTIIAGLERMLRRLIGEDIEMCLHLAPDLGSVRADPGQLEQVLMNLVVNSRDAMERGGALVIETTNAEIAPDDARRRAGVEPGAYVCMRVTDTGCGMDAATMTRIFEPFFTTKAPNKGTGLGLSMVYGIVQQSGGRIDVESEPGCGTTFRIYLPRQSAPMSVVATGTSARPVQHASGTVLFVEDDPAVRRLVHRILNAVGYTVLVASTGAEAIALAARLRDAPIDLLLTDVVLPGLDGGELAHALMTDRPSLKVLYITGYAGEAELRHRQANLDAAVIQKPFTVPQLLERVRAALSREGDGTPAP